MDRDEELRELMLRYQRGEQDAVRELYGRTAASIRRYLGRWTDWTRAQDLTQETFLQIHRARRSYRPELPLLPWMFAIARNVGVQHARTRSRRVVEFAADEPYAAVAADSTESALTARHDVARAMKELSDDERELVQLADIFGFSSAEIARVVSASEGAVRVRLHRAHRKMKAVLSGNGESGV